MGAIGLESNVLVLKNSLVSDPAQEVRETCELALNRIEQLKGDGGNGESSTEGRSPFMSVDPAAPASSCSSVDQLRFVSLLAMARSIFSCAFCVRFMTWL